MNEEFYNPNIKKSLVTINGDPHQLFQAVLQARDVYSKNASGILAGNANCFYFII